MGTKRLLLSCFTISFICLPTFAGYSQPLNIPSLPLMGQQDLDPLIKAIGSARLVVLGEGAHGGSEYHLWRRAITQRLVREKAFRCIAVEGEWADCFRVNEATKNASGDSVDAVRMLQQFGRWPSWTWANAETVELLKWLRGE